ncbi:MAG TPA: TetR/AcrR family transcriptional regulator [Rhizomicrobium sp.]
MRQKLLTSRSEILIAAADLFSRNGYHSTSMQDVAERLAVSKPTLYASFGNKEALLSESIDFWLEAAEQALVGSLEAEGGPRERIRALVHAWSQNAAAHRNFYLVFLSESRDFPAAITQRHRKWSRSALRRIRNCVRDGQSLGVFRADADPIVMAFSVVSFINAIPQWFDPRGELSIQDVAGQFVTLLEGGLLARRKAARP